MSIINAMTRAHHSFLMDRYKKFLVSISGHRPLDRSVRFAILTQWHLTLPLWAIAAKKLIIWSKHPAAILRKSLASPQERASPKCFRQYFKVFYRTSSDWKAIRPENNFPENNFYESLANMQRSFLARCLLGKRGTINKPGNLIFIAVNAGIRVPEAHHRPIILGGNI